MTKIPSNLLSSTNQLSILSSQAQSSRQQTENLSSGAKTRLAIIEQAIPDSIFTLPTTSTSTVGVNNLEKVEQNVATAVNNVVAATNSKIVNLSTVRFGGLLGIALNQLPQKIELPNLAEIKEVVYNRLKELRRKQRTAIVQSQIQAAKLEELPFTARQNEENLRDKQLPNQIRGLYG